MATYIHTFTINAVDGAPQHGYSNQQLGQSSLAAEIEARFNHGITQPLIDSSRHDRCCLGQAAVGPYQS